MHFYRWLTDAGMASGVTVVQQEDGGRAVAWAGETVVTAPRREGIRLEDGQSRPRQDFCCCCGGRGGGGLCCRLLLADLTLSVGGA